MHFKGLSKETAPAQTAGLFLTDGDFLRKTRPLFESGGLSVGVARQLNGAESLDAVEPAELGDLGVVVFDLLNHGEPLRAARELVDRCRSDAAVVVLGRPNDVSFYRDLRSLGVTEYFSHPVPADELVTSVRRLAGLYGGQKRRRGLTIAVHGVHGGLGAGLLTAGLGAFISQIYGRETVMVDSDLATPSVGGYLGVDTGGNLQEILEAADRLDWVLIQQAIQLPLDRLALLYGLAEVDGRKAFEPEAFARLGSLLEDRYRYQIWRSHAGSPAGAPVLEGADLAILVTSGTLPCVRSTQNVLRWLSERNPSARLIVCFNQIAPSQCFSPANLSRSLGLELTHVIPFLKGLGDDLIAGTPFTQKSHSLHKSLTRMAHDIMGRISERSRAGA
jgi:Flp pilus assembly CpaE family ATPase